MNIMNKDKSGQMTGIAAASVLASAAVSQAGEKEDKFLEDIKSDDADVRYAAWIKAPEMDPSVIGPLGKLLVADRPGVAMAAEEALDDITHSVGVELSGEKWEAVVKEFLALVSDDQPEKVRRIAFHKLSMIAKDESVPVVAKHMTDDKLQEEAVFCLERIPSKKSTQALIESLEKVKDDFKPRVLAALGHREDAEAVDVCAEMMGSSNNEIAIAAMKAVARIGKKPSVDAQLPKYSSLSDVHKTEYTDSWLRYADALAKNGDLEQAWGVFNTVMDNAEKEHYKCAAIVGLAKIGKPQSIDIIIPHLVNDINNIRRTANKALKAMQGDVVEKKLKAAKKNADDELKIAIDDVLKARKAK